MKVLYFPKLKDYATAQSIHGFVYPIKADESLTFDGCSTLEDVVTETGIDPDIFDGTSLYHRIQDVVETLPQPVTLINSPDSNTNQFAFHTLEQTFTWTYKAGPAKKLSFFKKFMSHFMNHNIDDGFFGVTGNAILITDNDENALAIVFFDGPTACSAVDKADCFFRVNTEKVDLVGDLPTKPATPRRSRKKQ